MEVVLHDVWALLAGFVVMTTLVFGFALAVGRFVPGHLNRSLTVASPYMAASVVFSFLAAAAGGYVTAWLSTGDPMPKVLMLAIVVLAISAISALEGRGRQPLAYRLASTVLASAGVVLGGYLRLRLMGLI